MTVRSQGNPIRVLIVDDHPTVREGLRYRIELQPDMTVCGEASEVKEALRKVQECRPDVVIADIVLKNSDGVDLMKNLRSQDLDVAVLAHSMYDESVYADRCLRAGAMGYVNKEADPKDVITALREIAAGRVYLSPTMANRVLSRTVSSKDSQADPLDSLTDRQLEVFRLIGEGKTAAQIAKILHISVHTVETHRDNIKQKLNISNVTELTRIAVLWGTANRNVSEA